MASLASIILAAIHIHQIVAQPGSLDCFDLENEGNDRSILENEAFKLTTFLDSLNPDEVDSFTMQCYKNTVELITTDQGQQIHSNGLFLWFLPATLTDSGNYSCFLRNKTYCVMDVFRIQVLQISHGQCFHESSLELPQEESPGSIQIYCHAIDYFQPFSVLQWFKDCNPITIDNKKYFDHDQKLSISDATSEDSGMYTCKLKYEHRGKGYNVTRTTELKMRTTTIKTIQPKMRNPKNNTIEARLGSALNITCETLVGFGEVKIILLTWKMNNTYIPEDGFRIKQGDQIDRKEARHAIVNLKNLTISKIIQEDFQTTFECFAYSPRGNCYGFFKIVPQSPDWTLHVIIIIVSLTFVILGCILMHLIFKVDMVLWYREKFESHKPINDGMTFDAYVIYPRTGSLGNYNTSNFALHILPKTLEETYGYKLYIPGRDECPGQAEVEVIEENIRKSKRLIIILAQNPSADGQGPSGFEHEIGLFEALIRNEMKVILIELGKGGHLNDFPESIRHLIQKNGTLKWKPESSYSRFWKQVRYEMPVRSKSGTSTVHDSKIKVELGDTKILDKEQS
ncbi:interleukin-1 receptor type 1-like [Scyliorhinus canicula]|uniref:interleukin-1 receptor type 1-like n=1 Tax=Scyliorhinus canicula TaxID=7830 RepID=UPI0018F4152E|nr:interleukin-1 receptor type 1-like [Scyliorhinus canicula]